MQISFVKYRVISAGLLDSLPEYGQFDCISFKDTLCQYISDLNKSNRIEHVNLKVHSGFTQFFFKNAKGDHLGKIELIYVPNSGYYTNLGGAAYYSHVEFPYFLLNKIKENQ